MKEDAALPVPDIRQIGAVRGVRFEVAAWDSVTAEVDVAATAVFSRELNGAPMTGGLRRLDEALSGALIALRKGSIFKGVEGNTMLLTTPPKPIRAKAILLVGAGDPANWSYETAKGVAARAMCEVLRLRSESAAFAPGILDSGIGQDVVLGVGEAFMRGAIEALLETHDPHVGLTRWVFDAGQTHIDAATEQFRKAFPGEM